MTWKRDLLWEWVLHFSLTCRVIGDYWISSRESNQMKYLASVSWKYWPVAHFHYNSWNVQKRHQDWCTFLIFLLVIYQSEWVTALFRLFRFSSFHFLFSASSSFSSFFSCEAFSCLLCIFQNYFVLFLLNLL